MSNKKEIEKIIGDIPCMDCKTDKNIVWFTDNVFWNSVMEGVKGSGILCIFCFVLRAENKYKLIGWRLSPEWQWKKRANIRDLLTKKKKDE